MDRHENAVVVLVDELYHLLGRAVDLRAQESAEAAYAVVHVDDEVARLD